MRYKRAQRSGKAWYLVFIMKMTGFLFVMGCARTEPPEHEFIEREFNGRPSLVVSVTDETEAEFAFKVAEIPFVVSNDRLHTILEGDIIVRDELWVGFAFYSVLPSFSPFSERDVSLFGRPSTERNFVHISVERFCPTFRDPADCNPKANIASLFAMGSYLELSEDWPIERVAGLTPFLHTRSGGGDPARPVPANDIFDFGASINSERDSYLSCDRSERVPVPHCEHRFIWKGSLRVKVTYKRSNIHDWRGIYLKSLQTLESITNQKPGTSGKMTIYFPRDHYLGE